MREGEQDTGEQADAKPQPRRALSRHDLAQIKRLLNIPQRAPLPKCPAKSKAKVRALYEIGDKVHRERDHAPCHKCTCPNTAGLGTDHYGYGWCYLHQIRPSEKDCKQMAEADLRAHQQRHPRVFRDAQQYLEVLEKESDTSAFDLSSEMEKARDLFATLHSRISNWDIGRSKIIDDLKTEFAFISATLAGAQTLTQDDKSLIQLKLQSIYDRLICPFTEKGAGGPQEMSDATLIRLQVDTAEQVTRIAERVQKLRSINMITYESFRDWLAKFYQQLKLEFGGSTYTFANDKARPILEGIGEAMRQSGDPRRGL